MWRHHYGIWTHMETNIKVMLIIKNYLVMVMAYLYTTCIGTWMGSSLLMPGVETVLLAFISSASARIPVFWPGRPYTNRFLLYQHNPFRVFGYGFLATLAVLAGWGNHFFVDFFSPF